MHGIRRWIPLLAMTGPLSLAASMTLAAVPEATLIQALKPLSVRGVKMLGGLKVIAVSRGVAVRFGFGTAAR